MRTVPVVAALIALGMQALPAMAQAPAVVTGRVTDSAGTPLARAEVASSRPARRAVTDANGRFRIDSLWPGEQLIAVRRMGFRSATTTLTLQPGERRSADFRLAVLPVPLDTIVTEAAAVDEYLRQVGFYRRQKMGFGDYVTRQELDRMAVFDVWDVIRRMPFLEVVERFGRRYVVTAEGRCRPHLFVDGLTVIDLDGIPVSIVDGIEVYRRSTLIPMEFSAAGRACAAIAVWTR